MRDKPGCTIEVCTTERATGCTRALLRGLWRNVNLARKRGHEFTRAAKSLKTIPASAPDVSFYCSDERPRSPFSGGSRFVPVIIAIAFLGTAFAQNTSYQQDPKWRVPADALAKPNPLAQKPEATAGGKKLFQRNCVECHGPTGTGVEKKHAADLQLATVQQQSDGTLFWKITNGNTDRGMPSFSRLPELQRWQLVLYLRTLKPVGEQQSKAQPK